ncbi:MAG TPA: PP2C family serine/threonine-protein phosphatase [Casimicrobiaceae bacterium]|jgi:serine/threonine protein phosphatase PrpC|nr:PP2C family serine/threonine-protein phosphatase [Casimicrobiaceae bacterium]
MPPDAVAPRVGDEPTPHEPASSVCAATPRGRSSTSGHSVRTLPWVRLETAAASARGKRRNVNEDCFSELDGSAPVFVVADGVGGGAMAARASRELVSQLHEALDGRRIDSGTIRNALLVADREVGRSIANHTNASGAATVALAAGSGMTLSRWLVAWVGDCRVYRLGAGANASAELLTVDDTYRHLEEAPPPGGSRDDPARMVGNGAVSAPNVDEVALRSGEMLVLVSDGVHKHIEPQDLSRVLHQPAPLVRRCSRLVALARARGSRDDATVLVVQREARRGRLAWLASSLLLLAALVITLMVLQ